MITLAESNASTMNTDYFHAFFGSRHVCSKNRTSSGACTNQQSFMSFPEKYKILWSMHKVSQEGISTVKCEGSNKILSQQL
jgi:hypothetical protein